MARTESLMTPGMTVYSPTARALHWFTAVLVLTMIPAGFVMVNIDAGPWQNFLFHLHRSFGVLLLPVMLLRLIYRLKHPPPPLPATVEPIHQLAAHSVHMALYALLIVQPIVGWIGTSAFRAPILVFGLFELPPIWPEDRAFSDQVFVLHRAIGILIAALLVAHIGAALFHHFVRRDQVLLRMWSVGRPT
jgi:cytochrome b561